MSVPAKSLTDITNQAIHVLSREIGAADTMRFLSQFSTGSGNYTEERAALFDHLTLDEVLAEIREKHGDKKQAG
ncbi:MAG: hypothetical protein JZU52_08625 [Lamprocystis purpurea]|jgi:hypothetical protein|uniref:hypothetical protein n=1 Tax=Lamprocystis purpurea TaxID=61598 RepID=UPI000A062344|nr:hypothetical protein [Lamprocystis purpurea]MBV5273692.1 hypothetical protein [Lamprocystis purpurea]